MENEGSMVAASETREASETAPEIKHDLSEVTKGEDYVAKLAEILPTMDDATLTQIVDSAAEDYAKFDPEQFGFKLPNELSVHGRNAQGEEVDLPDTLSSQRALVANVATELFLRRLNEATEIPRHDTAGANRYEFPESKVAQLGQVERMANALYSPVMDRDGIIRDVQARISEKESYYDRETNLRTDDKKILEELLFDKDNLTKDQLKHLGANDYRMNYMLQSLRETLTSPQYALRLDSSLARVQTSGPVNIDRYGGAYGPVSQQNMEKFADLNKNFEATKQEKPAA